MLLRLPVCLLAAVVTTAAAYASAAPPAQDDAKLLPLAPLHEEVLHLPGDPGRRIDLVVTLFTPEGPGPFPLAVMNHGANGSKELPANMERYRHTYSAYYFLSRGYAVALPMARGYGGSGGGQGFHACDLVTQALENGRDIRGVIAALKADPRIDGSRIVVAGQSFGGWNTLGLGAQAPEGVRGLVNFVGGIRSSACAQGGQGGGSGDSALVEGARELGARTKVPALWIYGENDSLFQPDVWQPMFRAYTQAGGKAELVDIGRFMDDSHQMLSHPESIPLWAPRVDAFLARIGLPSAAVFPAYLPLRPPPPTHFAAIDDVDAVPWANAAGKDAYRQFLTRKLPRVFLVASGGQTVVTDGGFDPFGRALALCGSNHLDCRPYAVDNDVVWAPPPPPAHLAATNFAQIGDVAAVPWVNDKSRAAYAHYLTLAAPKAFLVSPDGKSVSAQGGYDPLSRGLDLCRKNGLECRPYAVDDKVVWTPPARH